MSTANRASPELSTDCVTAEDARDPVKALSSMQRVKTGSKCQVFNVKQAGNVVSFVMKCGDPKEGSIDDDGEVRLPKTRATIPARSHR